MDKTQQYQTFVLDALEASIYVAGRANGLTIAELKQLGKSYETEKEGGIRSTLQNLCDQGRVESLGHTYRIVGPSHSFVHFATGFRSPEYRNFDAIEFVLGALDSSWEESGSESMNVADLLESSERYSSQQIDCAIALLSLSGYVEGHDPIRRSPTYRGAHPREIARARPILAQREKFALLVEAIAKLHALPVPSCHNMNALFARTNAPSEAEFVNKQVSPVTIVHQVFIGHGRSSTWREVKDFVQDRLRVKVQEFNSESAAGLPTQQRLQELLDTSTFALLIMTAEDEKADGKRAARPNVIHEIGLFQGRLGFARAIVILENGCDEFSNIVGLTQLRFDPGNIATVFEEIRKVMEREGVIRAG